MSSKKNNRGSQDPRTRQAFHKEGKHPFYEITKEAATGPVPFLGASPGRSPWSTSAVLEISDRLDVIVTMDQVGLARHMNRGGTLPAGLNVMAAAVLARESYEVAMAQAVSTRDGLISNLVAMKRLDQLHRALREFRPKARLEQAQIALRHGELAARAHAAALAHPEWDLTTLLVEGEMPLNQAACASLLFALMEITKIGLTGHADYAAARALLGELVEDLPADFSAKTIGVKLRSPSPVASDQ